MIYWHLNEKFIGATRHIHQLGIAPTKGSYMLTLIDENGYSLTHRFEIIDP
jgi:penicillin-binding protein 1C